MWLLILLVGVGCYWLLFLLCCWFWSLVFVLPLLCAIGVVVVVVVVVAGGGADAATVVVAAV